MLMMVLPFECGRNAQNWLSAVGSHTLVVRLDSVSSRTGAMHLPLWRFLIWVYPPLVSAGAGSARAVVEPTRVAVTAMAPASRVRASSVRSRTVRLPFMRAVPSFGLVRAGPAPVREWRVVLD